MTEKQFVKGFKVTKKEGKYGTFYKCGISRHFCENNTFNDKGWCNFTIFESKEGKPYAVIDTYGTEQADADGNIVQFTDENIPF